MTIAMYRVSFNDGVSLIVYSADAKSLKKADLHAACVKARKKAQVERRKTSPKVKATGVRCVG